MNYTNLPGPEFPQMSNDGYITDVELASNEGVIININQYEYVDDADYLSLYWDGRLVNTLSLTGSIPFDWPWSSTVPAEYAPDGPHQAYYTVYDQAKNVSASSISSAAVDRNHTDGLPAPLFSDAADGIITYDSVVENNGTHIQVPNTASALATGDTVYIYWGEYDAQGTSVTGSNIALTHIVEDIDITSGFTVLVPPPYVTQVNPGTARAWYSVVPQQAEAKSSATGIVNIDMSIQTTYPAPLLPAGNDGWIDCSEITGSEGTEIDIPANALLTEGGTVVVCWQGYDSTGEVPGTSWKWIHTLSATDGNTGFSTLVPAIYITPVGIGYARAWYQVSGVAQPGSSSVTQVNIDSQHCTVLPAPIFPAAVGDNILTQAEVMQDDGTDMTVSYPDMVEGDMVTAFWFGYQDSPEMPISGTNWTETRTVTLAEAQASQLSAHIPATKITPIGSGHGEGRYQVMFKNGGIASSALADVNVSVSAADTLQISCSTGAHWFDPALYIRPMNEITLEGPAGSEVVIALSSASDAWFYPSATHTLVLTLDNAGRGSAQVYSLSAGGVTVSAYVSDNPTMDATANMTFTDWLTGSGELQYYGMSSGAISDGKAVCSVYVRAASATPGTQAKLTLTGSSSAIIPISDGQVAWVDISETASGSFDVTDLTPELVNFTLSLPDSSGAYVVGSLSFTLFSLIEK